MLKRYVLLDWMCPDSKRYEIIKIEISRNAECTGCLGRIVAIRTSNSVITKMARLMRISDSFSELRQCLALLNDEQHVIGLRDTSYGNHNSMLSLASRSSDQVTYELIDDNENASVISSSKNSDADERRLQIQDTDHHSETNQMSVYRLQSRLINVGVMFPPVLSVSPLQNEDIETECGPTEKATENIVASDLRRLYDLLNIIIGKGPVITQDKKVDSLNNSKDANTFEDIGVVQKDATTTTTTTATTTISEEIIENETCDKENNSKDAKTFEDIGVVQKDATTTTISEEIIENETCDKENELKHDTFPAESTNNDVREILATKISGVMSHQIIEEESTTNSKQLRNREISTEDEPLHQHFGPNLSLITTKRKRTWISTIGTKTCTKKQKTKDKNKNKSTSSSNGSPKEHNTSYECTDQSSIPNSELEKIDWASYTTATRHLLRAVFPRHVLATHSLTGKQSPAFMNKPAKQCLDPVKVEEIVNLVSNNCGVPRRLVRSCITIKCTDEAKMYRNRLKAQAAKLKKKGEQSTNNVQNSPDTTPMDKVEPI